MKLIICHNCGGFGITLGPIIQSYDDDSEAETEMIAYQCLACGGDGSFLIDK